MSIIINEEGSVVVLFRSWLSNSREIYETLENNIEWFQPKIKVFGKVHSTPRLQYALADEGCVGYRYSGSDIKTVSWDDEKAITNSIYTVKNIRDMILVDEELSLLGEFRPNSCLLNFYRNGEDTVGYHVDSMLKDSEQSVITVSLGATRTFRLKHISSGRVVNVELLSGDMILMCGKTQEKWKHCIPRVSVKKVGEGRISLTYRAI